MKMNGFLILLLVLIILTLISIFIIIIVRAFTGPANTTCTKQSDCASGYVCDNGTCKAGKGTTCQGTSDCASGYLCANNVCKAGQGTYCANNSDCAAPYQCANHICVNITAADPVAKNCSSNIDPTPITVPKIAPTPLFSTAPPLVSDKSIQTPLSTSTMVSTHISTVPSSTATLRRPGTIMLDSTPSPPPPKIMKQQVYSPPASNVTSTDQPLDVHSGASSRDEEEVVISTPPRNAIAVSTKVIDMCGYSNAVISILPDSTLTVETAGERKIVTSNIKLRRIVSFNGYLFGLDNAGALYSLPTSYFHNSSWIWTRATWAPANIIHICATHDAALLWIQTSTDGYLYGDADQLVMSLEDIKYRRVYGRDMNHYLDIYPDGTAKVYPGENRLHNIVDAILTYYDEIITVTRTDRHTQVVLVNWEPYYI